MAVWVRFGVQLNYSCRLKSVPSDEENRVPRTNSPITDLIRDKT